MAEVGTAFVTLVPSARGFGKKMQGQVGPQVEREGRSLGSKLSGAMGKTLKGGAIAAGGAITAIFGTAFVKGFSRLQGIEQAEAKLRGLGHSAKSVEAIMTNALGAVKGTAFGLDEAASVAASTVAAGVKPGKQLEETLTLVGDAATIAGVGMNEMGAIFNKVAASNKIQGDVIAQLNDAGIPIIQLLGKELGKTAEETLKLSSEGKVNFATFQKAMKAGLGGAAQESGKTFSGALANMQAALGRLGASALEGVFTAMPAMFGRATDALDRLGPVAEDVGEILADRLATAAQAIQKLWPKVQALIEAWTPTLKALGSEALDVTKALGAQLVPAAGKLLDVATGLGEFIANIPGPLKEIGVQAGIAALILPRLAGAATSVGAAFTTTIARVKQFHAEMTYAELRAQRTSLALGRLGAAAKTAAGVGGMVALAQGAQRADSATGAMMTTAGAAALGLSMGGGLGAVVGGVAGGLLAMKRANDASRESFKNSIKFAQEYGETLDGVTGAITKQTKATIFQNLLDSEALTVSRSLGIADRDMIGYVLGKGAAVERVTKKVDKLTGSQKQLAGANSDAFYFNKDSAQDFLDGLTYQGKMLDEDQRKKLRAIRSTQTWTQALKGVPKKVRTELKQVGFEPSLKQLRRLDKQYDLTPKQLRTIIKATGVDVTVKQVERVKGGLKDTEKSSKDANKSLGNVGKAKPNNTFDKTLKSLLTGSEKKSKGTSKQIDKFLKNSSNTKASTTWQNSLTSSIVAGRSSAASGSVQIGNNLKNGLPAGFAGADGLWSSAVRRAVAAAIAAGKREADSHSPSRKTMALGRDLAAGLDVGLRRSTNRVVKAARNVVGRSVKAMKKALRSAKQQLRKITKRVDAFKSIRDQVRGAFSPDLFSGSLAEFLRGTASQLADNRAVKAALRTLRKKGAKGNFLTSLMSSGNASLILGLAGADEKALKQAQRDWNAVQSTAGQIGSQVAKADVGASLGQLNREMKRLNKTVDKLDKRIGREVGRSINRGAKKGKRSGRR